MGAEQVSTKQKQHSKSTRPSGPVEVFDPSGELSLKEWIAKHRGPGKHLEVPESVSAAEFQEALADALKG
jgi:hypothetical protein